MELSALAGNERIKHRLSPVQDGQALSHAYIISGPRGAGKHTLAGLLAKAALCQGEGGVCPCGVCSPCKKIAAGIHPDVKTLSGEGEKPIPVDQIRALQSDAHILPNEGRRKVYLLERADKMNQSAQNTLLKLLEEGPPYAMFLLLAENGGGVLQTVRSRCEALPLTPAVPAEPDEEELALRDTAQKLAAVIETGDELALFEACMALEGLKKEPLILLLGQLTEALARRMAAGGDGRRLLKAIELTKTLRGAAQLNANPGQLSGWLCAALSEGAG